MCGKVQISTHKQEKLLRLKLNLNRSIWKMGSKIIASVTLFLSLNLFLLSMVSSQTLVPAPPPECPELSLCLDVARLGATLHPGSECCSLLGGLVQANGTLCICDQARLQIIGIDMTVNLVLQQIRNMCQQNMTYSCT